MTTTPIHNPATGEQIGTTTDTTTVELQTILTTAQQAQRKWEATSIARRTDIVRKFGVLLRTHTDEIAKIVSTEQGKTFADAKGEVARGLEVVDYATNYPAHLAGQYSFNAATDLDVTSLHQPLGVVAGITPFNFPVMIPLWMASLAIVTGNAFVLKPPERCPSAAIRLAQLWQEAGLPDGVLQVAHGGAPVVTALVEDPIVQAVSFVGSTPTAKIVYQMASKHYKRVQAFGGAKNHGVIMEDANIEHAVNNIIAAAFGAAGERCMALPVVLVHESIADEVIESIIAKAKDVTVGPWDNPSSDLGPIITKEALARIHGLIASAEDQGATVLLDGRTVEVPDHPNGYFLAPTILDNVTPDMTINQTEVFGPVLEIIRIKTLDEAIEIISNCPYGNGTAIFTNSGYASRRFMKEIQVGMVGINVPIPVPVGWHSFGGWKDSSFGDIGMYGSEGLRFYTKKKTVTQKWVEPQSDSTASFAFPQN